jgi:putative endonuclease
MSKTIGQYYEQVALEYLKKQGLTLVEKNYHCPFGEIDLIFKQPSWLIFVEVKYRHTLSLTNPLESIDSHKQRRLICTAEHYLQRHTRFSSVNTRFDFILIQSPKNNHQDFKIEWMQDVWMGGD